MYSLTCLVCVCMLFVMLAVCQLSGFVFAVVFTWGRLRFYDWDPTGTLMGVVQHLA